MTKTEVIIVGAGQGTRMGGDVPKVLLPLGPYPVYLHSVLTLARMPEIDGLILVVPQGQDVLVRTLCQQHDCTAKIKAIVPGGGRRQDSVAAGYRHVSEAADLILIHDAARPLVTPALVVRVIEETRVHGIAIPGMPVVDTLKCVDEKSKVVRTVPREALRAVQTPQGFARKIFAALYQQAQKPDVTVTDEAALAEHLGLPVHVVEGELKNFKLTTPWDWQLAQWLWAKEAAQ